MQGNVRGNSKSGGDVINGIIEEYVAQGNISAGGFVEYIQNLINETDIAIKTTSKIGYKISAVALSDNKVFISHCKDINFNTLYGTVCTISNNTIIAGTSVIISSTVSVNYAISTVALNENAIFITYGYNYESNNTHLYGIVCTISGNIITTGTETAIYASQNVGYMKSAVLINTNKIFIAYSGAPTGYYLSGVVCTVSGTDITIGTKTSIYSYSYGGRQISAVKLSTDRVFIAHTYLDYYYLHGAVCSISGTTITVEVTTLIGDGAQYKGKNLSAVALNNSRVFIAHTKNGSSNYGLFGIVCMITKDTSDNTVIKFNTDTELIGNANGLSVIKVSSNKVFITHNNDSSNYYLYGMICEISAGTLIDNTTITVESNTQLSSVSNTGFAISTVVLLEEKYFIVHSYSSDYYLYGMIAEYIQKIRAVTSSSQTITGIAKNNATSGQTVQVYVPEVSS